MLAPVTFGGYEVQGSNRLHASIWARTSASGQGGSARNTAFHRDPIHRKCYAGHNVESAADGHDDTYNH